MIEIVVGIDGSQASVRALEFALREIRARGEGVVTLAHAYRSPATNHATATAYPYLPTGTLQRLSEQERDERQELDTIARQQAERIVERALDQVEDAVGPAIVKRLVMAREPARALVELSHDADLLVVGSRGRGGFGGLRLGSVSQQCVRHASGSVVVVR